MPPSSGPAPRREGEIDAAGELDAARDHADVEGPDFDEAEGNPDADPRQTSGEAAAAQSADRPATPPPPAHAAGDSSLHDDPLADAFFRHPDKPVIDVWEDHAPVVHTMSRGSRRAMIASIGIFVVSVLSIGTYSIYQNWIMPAPAELGATVGDLPAVLPTPLQPPPAAAEEPARETQLAAATNPEPEQPQPESTLAAIAARQPVSDPTGAEPKIEGAAGEHLRDSADESTRVAERLRDSRNMPLGASVTGSGGSSDPAPPQEEPVRAFGTTAAPSYDELVEVGRALSKRNRRVEASEAFRRALLKSPRGSAALSGLSYVYLNAEENQTARNYAERAVQSDATNAEGWIVLGAALELLGDRAGAQNAYRNCVERGQGPYLLECRRVLR